MANIFKFGLIGIGAMLIFIAFLGIPRIPGFAAISTDAATVCQLAKTWSQSTLTNELAQVNNEIATWSTATIDSVRNLAPSLATADTATLTAKLAEINANLATQKACLSSELCTRFNVGCTTAIPAPAVTTSGTAAAQPIQLPAGLSFNYILGGLGAGMIILGWKMN